MALEGDLSLFRLPDILQVVAHQQKTGILTVQGKSDILAVSFLGGEIVAADALNQSFEELLGGVLARRGSVSTARFAELADGQRRSTERLVDYLVERGAVGRDELLESLRELTYQLLLEMLRWREGQFKFYGGEEVAYEEGIKPLRVDEVVMRSLSDLAGEPGRAGWVPRGYLPYARTRDSREVREIPSGFDDSTPLDAGVAWLTPDERKILERLDGRTPAELLARETGLGQNRTFYALFRLLQAGLARPVGDGDASDMAATPAPAKSAKVEALRVERLPAGAQVLPEVPTHPALRQLSLVARWLALPSALGLAVASLVAPAGVLHPAPCLTAEREAFDRLRRLSRFDLIDRGARTYHLLEGRYPSSFGELVELGLIPARSARDTRGRPLALRSQPEEYRIVTSEKASSESGMREGVFGDFLLDRQMFAGLERDTGIPIVLID